MKMWAKKRDTGLNISISNSTWVIKRNNTKIKTYKENTAIVIIYNGIW